MHFVGIDISKSKVDLAWLRDEQNNKVKTKIFKNNLDGFDQIAKWLVAQTKDVPDAIYVAMEATGVYHEGLAYSLHSRGFKVSVVNPALLHNYAKSQSTIHKTDKRDSLVIARFCLKEKPDLWQPEPENIRKLKALLTRLEALDQDIRRELNRLEAAEITRASPLVLESIHSMIGQLKKEQAHLNKEIDDHIDKDLDLKRDRQLLESIPGIGPVIARYMIMVVRSRPFKNAPQVAAYLGVIPRLVESGTMKGRSFLSKRGPSNVRAKLYMAAISATQYNPDIKRQRQRLLANSKTKMQALCAGMRKLVHICFGVLKHQTEYQPQAI